MAGEEGGFGRFSQRRGYDEKGRYCWRRKSEDVGREGGGGLREWLFGG